jgi:hypothetical protein
VTARLIGAAGLALTVVLAAADRLSGHTLSSAAARALCGTHYLAPVGGTVGDLSCGFNADLHFMAAMAATAVVGAVFVVLAGRRP